MLHEKHLLHRQLTLVLTSFLCVACTLPVVAADPVATPLPAAEPFAVSTPPVAEPQLAPAPVAAPEAGTAEAPSQNVTINLINRLVQRGVLTKEDAADLIRQAEADAAAARAQASAAQAAPPSDDTVRVTYIPEVVKDQIRDDLRSEVMKQAYEEKWASPRTFPTWVTNFRLFGDMRMRYQNDSFPPGNDTTGSLLNFNTINTGSPYDISSTSNTNYPASNNADKERNRLRLRARAGAEVDLGEGFTTGLRFGTGDTNSPVTENQTLGGVNSTTAGQGGNFSKYSIWLDRAFIKYETNVPLDTNLSATVGRFDNPFFATKMIWADDLGFDGGVLQAKYKGLDCVTPFFTAGAFPVYNTDFNFASNNPSKFSSQDKWLEGFQLGSDVKITHDWSAKEAVAYYMYQNVEGQLSTPFYVNSAADIGNTDALRPTFAQKGNTYMMLRNIISTSANSNGTTNQYQYFGLVTPFRELALTGQVDYAGFDPCHIALTGEVVKNLAFDRSAIDLIAQNNFGPDTSTGKTGPFNGGDTGWLMNLNFGAPTLQKRWDWNVNVGYRYVESDAVIDGFCDSDFGGGGTNLKGFTLGGGLGLSSRVWLSARWMSADSIAGPTFKTDIFQFDLNAKF